MNCSRHHQAIDDDFQDDFEDGEPRCNYSGRCTPIDGRPEAGISNCKFCGAEMHFVEVDGDMEWVHWSHPRSIYNCS